MDEENNSEKFIQKVRELKQIYQNVFESDDGKKVLEDLSKRAFVNKTVFNENPQRMAFNEGCRSIILHIKSMMNIDIEKTKDLINKQKENNDV